LKIQTGSVFVWLKVRFLFKILLVCCMSGRKKGMSGRRNVMSGGKQIQKQNQKQNQIQIQNQNQIQIQRGKSDF
jgi:hypothetical protein